MLRVARALSVTAFFTLLGLAGGMPSLAQPAAAEKQSSVRGKVVVAPELLAATEWPVDDARAKSMRTPANVRRPSGRVLAPLTEAVPDVVVVLEGDDVRADTAPPKTLVVEGMRFSPGQALLPRPGPIAIENKQGLPLTIVDQKGATVATIAPGQTQQVSLADGVHTLSMKELPYGVATVRVLAKGRILPFDENGEIARTAVDAGDYELSFYLGANELHRRPLQMGQDGQLYIEATVSANTVVDATIKDASVQIAVPVSGGGGTPE